MFAAIISDHIKCWEQHPHLPAHMHKELWLSQHRVLCWHDHVDEANGTWVRLTVCVMKEGMVKEDVKNLPSLEKVQLILRFWEGAQKMYQFSKPLLKISSLSMGLPDRIMNQLSINNKNNNQQFILWFSLRWLLSEVTSLYWENVIHLCSIVHN